MADGDLQSLGLLLRQSREAYALSLEEVEEQTRIRAKFLRALESGDVSILPSIAHAKGFLRNYAQFLRLDANTIVAQFVDLTGSSSTPVTTSTAPPSPVPATPTTQPNIPAFERPETPPVPTVMPHPTERTRPVYIAPGKQVGPAGPLGASQGKKSSRGTETGQSKSPRPSSIPILRSNWIVGAILGIGMLAIVWWTVTRLSTITGEQLIPTEQFSNIAKPTVTSDTAGSIPIGQPTLVSSPTAGIPILDRVLLTMAVTRRTWVRIVVDGEIVYEGQAEPGNLLQYTGQQSIVVIAGNGAGLDATYNGQEIGLLGKPGEAIERIFTSSGQVTPTPTPTLTPTSTGVPTATPRVTQTPAP
ncbi:MAG: helix-turn-helix domain-containing protein [Anaerolineae bacterium]|nr:helix-turn-helix domain-containing protein [Anaerolineae bacterium]